MIAIIDIMKPSVTNYQDLTAVAKCLVMSPDTLYRRLQTNGIFVHNGLIIINNVDIVKSSRGGTNNLK
jgi:hypothetical protein